MTGTHQGVAPIRYPRWTPVDMARIQEYLFEKITETEVTEYENAAQDRISRRGARSARHWL